MGFNDYDDDFYANTEDDPDFYDVMDGFDGEDSGGDDEDDEDGSSYYDDSMDGDTDSALGSCGWGTDEYYGFYGDEDA